MAGTYDICTQCYGMYPSVSLKVGICVDCTKLTVTKSIDIGGGFSIDNTQHLDSDSLRRAMLAQFLGVPLSFNGYTLGNTYSVSNRQPQHDYANLFGNVYRNTEREQEQREQEQREIAELEERLRALKKRHY